MQGSPRLAQSCICPCAVLCRTGGKEGLAGRGGRKGALPELARNLSASCELRCPGGGWHLLCPSLAELQTPGGQGIGSLNLEGGVRLLWAHCPHLQAALGPSLRKGGRGVAPESCRWRPQTL